MLHAVVYACVALSPTFTCELRACFFLHAVAVVGVDVVVAVAATASVACACTSFPQLWLAAFERSHGRRADVEDKLAIKDDFLTLRRLEHELQVGAAWH